MSRTWIYEFWYLVGIILLTFFIGLLIGQIFLLLWLGSLTYISWHFYNLYRLEYWFVHSKKFNPPEAPGIWGEIFYHIYRLQQRNRKRKRKLGTILKRFRNSTAAMPDATVVLDKKYEIEWFNQAAGKLLGLKLLEDRGEPITNLIRSPVFSNYLKQIDKEESINLVSPINPNLMLKIRIVPYAGRQNLLIARPITQLYRLEKIRQNFITNISSELHTPIKVINKFIDAICNAKDDCIQQSQDSLLVAAQYIMRIRNLVELLILLSYLETEFSNAEVEKDIAVADIISAILEEVQIFNKKYHHNITLELDNKLTISGCVEELRSAFVNLIFNAIYYTPPRGEIKIKWYQNESGKHFEVQDNGQGIDSALLLELNEPLSPLDIHYFNKKELGLTIVKHVLNRHNGLLRIESVIGKKSIFYCDFL
ncbi:MAG: DUF3329 domain-containing protein [Thiomargarita sp.]|nr:DUF3329 domain-containing protein [Thiomargarita sp.]